MNFYIIDCIIKVGRKQSNDYKNNIEHIKRGVFMNGKKHDNNAMTTYTEEVAYCACTPKRIGVVRHVRKRYDSKNNVETQYVGEEIICDKCREQYQIEHCAQIFGDNVQLQNICLVRRNNVAELTAHNVDIYPLTFFIKKDLKQYKRHTD